MSNYSDYTYEEYLEVWHRHFGDAETGEYGYWHDNVYMPYTLTRLSPEKFAEHVRYAVEADEAFDRAMRAEDGYGIEAALAAGFPHELALLV